MKLIPLLLLFGALACEGYRILVVFPIPGKSHGILAEGVIRLLLDAGHEVTSIVPFKREKSHPKLTEIIPEENKKFFDENTINIQMIMDKKIDFTDQSFLQRMMLNIAKTTLMQANVKQLLTSPRDHFDVVISEWLYADVNSVLPAVFGCPLIWVSTIEPHWQVMRLVDEPLNPALYTDFYGSAVAPFSFVQRVQNQVSQVLGQIRVNRYSQAEEQFYLEYIVPILKQKGKPVPEYSELVFNASLILGNSHVSMGVPTKLPPSYKDVGGYHINPKVAPLPDDLKTLLDNAKHGVIYFSMGSNLKSKDIPQGVKDGLLKLFGELKQTVLWKFEEVLPNMPKNVHILKWAPQPSILSHRNTILFITHGGLLSTTEAIQFGKPLIGIPVFADQFTNVAKAVNKGFARKVDLAYDMADVLREEIKEVVGNPKYAQRAKEWSLVYHDRPVTPGQELVHWVEHVVKTQGAPHLRSPALMLAWYQRAYLDLAALVLIILLIVAYVLKVVLSKILGGSKSVQKKKKA